MDRIETRLKKLLLLFLISSQIGYLKPTSPTFKKELYICTSADKNFFFYLKQFIGSIHKTNFENLKELSVFNLGLSEEQLKWLNTVEKIKVYDVEKTNPDIFKRVVTDQYGKETVGWYSWKPVVIKQALDLHPYMLYIDAGCIVLKSLETIFQHIQENNYFLVQDQAWLFNNENKTFTIHEMCVSYVIEKLNLLSAENCKILKFSNLSSGIQGLTKAVYKNYVLPMYELSKDIKYFEDDSSAPLGFGLARHDQTLFSIQARLLNLNLVEPYTGHLLINKKKIPIGVGRAIGIPYYDLTIAYHARPYQDIGQLLFESYINFKNPG